MAAPKLRSVKPDEQPSARQAWLALYRQRVEAERRVAQITVDMRALKGPVMESLSLWGLNDEQLARELQRQ